MTTSWSVWPRPRWRSSIAPVAEIEVRRLGERPVRGVDDDLGQVGRDRRLVLGDPGASRLAVPGHERHAPLVAPDRRRPEDVVAVGMVEMAVRVDDDRDRVRVSSRRSVRISRAWTWVERVSITRTWPSASTTPMFWSKKA